MGNRAEIRKTYFGAEVVAFITEATETWHPYPWRFRVIGPDGVQHAYAGIPNQCATRAQALRRGWWRAKWLADGSHNRRYR